MGAIQIQTELHGSPLSDNAVSKRVLSGSGVGFGITHDRSTPVAPCGLSRSAGRECVTVREFRVAYPLARLAVTYER
jgi:hypothetical protein